MKKENLRTNILKILVTGLLLMVITLVQGQGLEQDEQAIREIVHQHEQNRTLVPHTQNNVFVSGAFVNPIIGGNMSADDKKERDKMKTERLNRSSNTRIERLVVSQAGDMAYEFGYADLKWDTPEGKHIAFESSYVRVWRKENNEWKVDVFMARPNVADNIDINDLAR